MEFFSLSLRLSLSLHFTALGLLLYYTPNFLFYCKSLLL